MAKLYGLHHHAKPTWKLRETVDFYENTLGLKLLQCLVAKGWGGPDEHPDFLHFFFDAGNGATIAFFYYLGTERPPEYEVKDIYSHRATHVAWNCNSAEELDAWQQRLESKGVKLMYRVAHEVVESIYFQDPNGYYIEIGYPVRDFTDLDATDAKLSLQTVIEMEDEIEGDPFRIEDVWERKGQKRKAKKAQMEGAI